VIADGKRACLQKRHEGSAGPVRELERLRRALARLLESHAQALELADGADGSPAGLRRKDWAVALALSVNDNEYLVLKRTLRPVDLPLLSARELAVVRHACAGHSNKEIAHFMGISTSTVRVLIFRACRKLHVASRARLIEALAPAFTAGA
jgi:DNA-binding CsgD family transcriptional regulator